MRRRQLSNRILTSVVGILIASTLVGLALTTLNDRAHLEQQYKQRALAIAETFASMPPIRHALAHPTPAARRLIQSLAQEVDQETGASYIVVLDRHGIRYSHPDPDLIGKRVSEPIVALDGHNHLGTDHGNLGISANAKTPLRSPSGQIIGEVSAGILEGRISGQLLQEIPSLLLYFACALGIGVIASLTLARRLKRSTFGLELDEIAALVQEREAMLHGIREGLITLDREGRVTLVNDEARRLIGLGEGAVGPKLATLVEPGRLRDLLTGATEARDEVVLTDEHVLVINRMPVSHQGRDLGAVVTLRDRTELEGLLRELDNVDALTDALRAQQHEFSNRMHTVAGLIELGDHEQAARYALDVSGASSGLAEAIAERIESPELAALLLAKTTIAAERGVDLELAEDSRLPETGVDTAALLTIVGNLIENAVDAAAAGPAPARVTVRLTAGDAALTLAVSDTGPGVPAEHRAAIFTDGFTTKSGSGRRNQGLGLALVHRLVHGAGGTIRLERSDTTDFTVVLPTPAPHSVTT
ncbi:MAG TPA: sensor histidine kinase [Solirubrobacteraceae bacterium]|nr:sensor histidine kinase [Solirubrobacteraceae bacterium]